MSIEQIQSLVDALASRLRRAVVVDDGGDLPGLRRGGAAGRPGTPGAPHHLVLPAGAGRADLGAEPARRPGPAAAAPRARGAPGAPAAPRGRDARGTEPARRLFRRSPCRCRGPAPQPATPRWMTSARRGDSLWARSRHLPNPRGHGDEEDIRAHRARCGRHRQRRRLLARTYQRARRIRHSYHSTDYTALTRASYTHWRDLGNETGLELLRITGGLDLAACTRPSRAS